MNNWTEKSYSLASSTGYLDKLFSEVYKLGNNEREKLSEAQKETISRLYNSDGAALIEFLLGLQRFPIDHPYIGYLRLSQVNADGIRPAIVENPLVVNDIYNRLIKYSIPELLVNCEKEFSLVRQMGNRFKEYILENAGQFNLTVIRNENEFLESEGDCLLFATDKKLKEFVERNFNIVLHKGFDLLVRINSTYILGEAKFISNKGGQQNNQFRDMASLADTLIENGENTFVFIGIVDGVVYLDEAGFIFDQLRDNDERVVLSALLLEEFFNSIRTSEE